MTAPRITRYAFLAALALASLSPMVTPAAPSYRLDVVQPIGSELHVFTVDYGLTLGDCFDAMRERPGSECVRDVR